MVSLQVNKNILLQVPICGYAQQGLQLLVWCVLVVVVGLLQMQVAHLLAAAAD
jgi:Tfp pilus assembly protein PilX